MIFQSEGSQKQFEMGDEIIQYLRTMQLPLC